MEIAIEIKSLSIKIDKKHILEKISFSVPKSGLTVLMGENGSGKTTLLRSICGNLQSTCGDIFICGKQQRLMKRSELSKAISYIPQSHTPIFRYSVLDFVLMGSAASLRIYEQPTDNEINKAIDIIRQLSLEDFIQTDYSTLSGGERQLALIARGLLQNAPIILLDEPVANLDFINQHRIMTILRKLSTQDITVLVTVHDPNLALKYADHVVFLHKAQVLTMLHRNSPDYLSNFHSALKNIYGEVLLTTQEHFEVNT